MISSNILNARNVSLHTRNTGKHSEVHGSWDENSLDLAVDRFEGGAKVGGNWHDEPVKLTMQTENHKLRVEGFWADQQVDLEITKSRGDIDIQGTVNGSGVGLYYDDNWSGEFTMQGQWGQAEVDLTSKEWKETLNVRGGWGEQGVRLGFTDDDVSSQLAGAAPAAMALPWQLIQVAKNVKIR